MFLMMQNSFAELNTFGLQCQGIKTEDLKNCLKKESSKIDEAKLPNEIILSTDAEGKNSLLQMVELYSSKNLNTAGEKIRAMIPLIESSVATALIIQYEAEPQLYYYIIDKDGKLEVVFDGINSVDVTETFSPFLLNSPDYFYLKSPNISAQFLEWLVFIKN